MSNENHRYRRRSTYIQAVQWDDKASSHRAILELGAEFEVPFVRGAPARMLAGKSGAQGWVDVPVGHWVAKASADDFYPIDPDVFAETYESAKSW